MKQLKGLKRLGKNLPKNVKQGQNLEIPNRRKRGENAPGETVCWIIFRTDVTQIE